jgi:hypothetical protein
MEESFLQGGVLFERVFNCIDALLDLILCSAGA